MKILVKNILILFITLILNSCLVPLSPHHHYYKPLDSNFENDPKLKVFSTPKNKIYTLGNIKPDAEVYIKSDLFENSNKYYLMNNSIFFEKEVKSYDLKINDSKFYKNNYYKKVTIKLNNENGERIISYELISN